MLPHYLMAAGYNCSAINTDLNTDIDPDEWAAYQSNDALLAQADEKPFFAVCSFGESHASVFKLTPEQAREQRSSLLTDEELHDPDNAPLPVFMPDTPLARERTALFHDGLMQVDRHVGEVIENLVSTGVLDNTIVFFWSDHGTGFPRGKTHVYDDGLRVPLIIRFPDKYQHLSPGPPGTVVDDLVMTMDMGASVLSMMDVQIPKHFQGQAFLGEQKEPQRDYVCGARDRLDNCNEVIRTIRSEKYRYIRNFLPHRPYASFWPDGGFFATPPEKGTPEHDFWDTSCLPGEQKIPALERALQSDLLWARFRAGANLSFYRREILAQMKELIPALQAALDNPVCYGPFEPNWDALIPPVQTMYRAQKDTIVGEWVLQRVIKRTELA